MTMNSKKGINSESNQAQNNTRNMNPSLALLKATVLTAFLTACGGGSNGKTNSAPTIENNGATITLNEGDSITMTVSDILNKVGAKDPDGDPIVFNLDGIENIEGLEVIRGVNGEEDKIRYTAPQVESSTSEGINLGPVSDNQGNTSVDDIVLNLDAIDALDDSPIQFEQSDISLQEQAPVGSNTRFTAAVGDANGVRTVGYRVSIENGDGSTTLIPGLEGVMQPTGVFIGEGEQRKELYEGFISFNTPESLEITVKGEGNIFGEKENSVKEHSAYIDFINVPVELPTLGNISILGTPIEGGQVTLRWTIEGLLDGFTVQCFYGDVEVVGGEQDTQATLTNLEVGSKSFRVEIRDSSGILVDDSDITVNVEAEALPQVVFGITTSGPILSGANTSNITASNATLASIGMSLSINSPYSLSVLSLGFSPMLSGTNGVQKVDILNPDNSIKETRIITVNWVD